MYRRLAVGITVVVLCGLVAVPLSTSAGDATGPTQLGATPEFDSTTFELTVYENGTARWTTEHIRPLDPNNETDQYEEFAQRFNSEELDLYTNFQDRATQLLANAENATGREMAPAGFSRHAYVNAMNNGVLQMTFLWPNFAVDDGDRVVVGDVFDSRLYVGPNQGIVIRAGPNLTFASIDPEGINSDSTLEASDSVTWRGERIFNDSQPRVELQQNAAVGGTESTQVNPTTATGTNTPGTTQGEETMSMFMVGLLVVAIALGGAALWRSGTPLSPAENDGDVAVGSATDAASADERATDTESIPAVSDEELLSDSDRVVKMLEANGGRMKQVEIVNQTDWSKSKVSMLLSDMEDDEIISKLRVGRENIISLKGFEPEAAGSPFDDE